MWQKLEEARQLFKEAKDLREQAWKLEGKGKEIMKETFGFWDGQILDAVQLVEGICKIIGGNDVARDR